MEHAFIDGIELLYSEQIAYTPPILIFFLTFSLVLLVSFGTVYVQTKDRRLERILSIPVLFSGIVFLASLIVFITVGPFYSIDEVHWVKLSDDVSMVDFYDKYELIETKGKVFIIKIKEGELE